jgi:uncharacterized alkaline shock family protein YloU
MPRRERIEGHDPAGGPERDGMIAPVRPAETGRRPTRRSREEDVARVPTHPTPGRSLVTRRALADIVRAATLGSYGVTGFAAGPIARLAAAIGVGQPGLRLDVSNGVAIELHLTVAYGVPVAEVARQVDSAVRYAVERATGRTVGRIAIHVGALRYQPGAMPRTDSSPAASRRSEAAEVERAEPVLPGRSER